MVLLAFYAVLGGNSRTVPRQGGPVSDLYVDLLTLFLWRFFLFRATLSHLVAQIKVKVFPLDVALPEALLVDFGEERST